MRGHYQPYLVQVAKLYQVIGNIKVTDMYGVKGAEKKPGSLFLLMRDILAIGF